ncbi:hypothetical protein M758_2G130900, partial [Ceratodon purpureus]
VPLIGVRGSPSSCRRARTVSRRSSLVLPAGGDECTLSNVDYQDVSSQWISANFLDLRLRSSTLICNEAVQALRKHFQKPSKAPPANVMSTASRQQDMEQAAPSACHVKKPMAMPTVAVYDEALFSQLYSPGTTYATMSCFLDESLC